MLKVTERAKEELKRILIAKVDEPGIGLRVGLAGPGGIDLLLDREKEGDQVVEHEGWKVLLVGRELSDTFEGMALDCQETAEGLRLAISTE